MSTPNSVSNSLKRLSMFSRRSSQRSAIHSYGAIEASLSYKHVSFATKSITLAAKSLFASTLTTRWPGCRNAAVATCGLRRLSRNHDHCGLTAGGDRWRFARCNSPECSAQSALSVLVQSTSERHPANSLAPIRRSLELPGSRSKFPIAPPTCTLGAIPVA
jgi:hypothetical protein